MAKISETSGRQDENSGYSRILGNPRLGHLISRVHATTIRAGTELEHLLEASTPSARKSSLGDSIRLAKRLEGKGVRVVFAPKIKKTKGKRGTIGDLLVFNHKDRAITLIELKDGDTFDTKKASGELQSLKAASKRFAKRTGYKSTFRFCSFNQNDKNAIIAGAKKRFTPDQVMTGRELCGILKIDYDSFVGARKQEQAANLQYLLRELMAIPELAERLQRMFR